jgi:hypothetical protein
MAIQTKKKRVVAAKDKDFPQATTHFPNETTKPEEESGQSVKNQQDWNDILIDPEDTDYGNTHFRNEETNTEDARMNPVKASTKAKNPAPKTKPTTAAAKKIDRLLATAGFDMESDEAMGYTQDDVPGAGEDPNATFSAGDEDSGTQVAKSKKTAKTTTKAAKKVKASEVDGCDEEGQQATTHFPNGEEVDPTDGYMMVGELEDLEGDEEFEDEDDEEVNADALEDEAGQTPQQSLLDVTDEHEVDAEFDDMQETGDEFDMEDHAEGEPEEVEDDALEDEGEVIASDGDDMSMMDVDGTDDEGDDAVFAAVGTRLHVIKANRIVASMGKKNAVKAGHADVYLGDQFQDACYAEFSKFGLRAGLKKMGFALAKVNVAKSDVVNKRVDAKAKQVTAAIRRTTAASNDALGQCLAIAAVGINRQYFKDTRNELRAALEEELDAAGVRGAQRLVRRVFASHGVTYAKAILMLANKLVSMPEEARNAFASALDMTSDGEVEDDSEEMFGQEAGPDFQSESDNLDGDDEDFVDEFEEEDAPETIHAALSRPLTKTRISAKASGYSPTAQAILAGTAKLPFSAF